MADYAASVLAKAQVMLNENFQKAEMKEKPSSVLMMLMKNRQFLIPNLNKLRDREDRPTKAYLKKRTKRATTGTRTHNHTGSNSDTQEVDIAYTGHVDKFATSLKRSDNNLLSDAEMMAHEMQNAFINLHEDIETSLVGFLDTNKNGVSAPPSGTLQRANFSAANDVYEIASGDSDEFLNIIKSVFRQEKYGRGSFDIILSSLLYSTHEFKANQGNGNSTNLGFQFGGFDAKESIEIADANYVNGLAFAAPVGMTGILDWIPKQNRKGKGNFDSVLGGYSSIIDPMTGLSFAVHGYTERADTDASNGNTQDELTEWEISIDLSPQVAPVSTVDETPLFAFGQL